MPTSPGIETCLDLVSQISLGPTRRHHARLFIYIYVHIGLSSYMHVTILAQVWVEDWDQVNRKNKVNTHICTFRPCVYLTKPYMCFELLLEGRAYPSPKGWWCRVARTCDDSCGGTTIQGGVVSPRFLGCRDTRRTIRRDWNSQAPKSESSHFTRFQKMTSYFEGGAIMKGVSPRPDNL